MKIKLGSKKNYTKKILSLILVITRWTGNGSKGLSREDKKAIKTVKLE